MSNNCFVYAICVYDSVLMPMIAVYTPVNTTLDEQIL